MGIKVISLFDGISCGMLALERAGIEVDKYVAFEIDKYAIKISQKNYPKIERRGSVIDADFSEFAGFDLLMGGSPCQDLSAAKINGKGLLGEKSKLFFEYVRALKEISPKYFLLENVASMKKENKDIISEHIGVEPIAINSHLLSALERNRLYWTNIPNIVQPNDLHIYCSDIIQPLNEVSEKYYFSERTYDSMNKILERSKNKGFGFRSGIIENMSEEKFKNLDANYYKGCDGKRSMFTINGRCRMATPIEAERLQTLPDNYTDCVSDTRRYHCLGNAWTVDVIAHIFRHMK